MAHPGAAPRSHSRRSHELFAAFNGSAEIDPGLPDYTESGSSATPSASAFRSRPSTDVFFDAGDALPEPDTSSNNLSDPLGADRANTYSAQTSTSIRPPPLFNRPGATPTYDFERPDYFPTATRRPPASAATSLRTNAAQDASSASNNTGAHQTIHMNFDNADNDADDSLHSTSDSNVNRNGYSSLSTSSSGEGRPNSGQDAFEHLSRGDRMRFALGRFGRFVGMGIPGARYTSLSTNGGGRGGVHRPCVVGGGIDQDGVFANLSAKPERRRRGQDSASPDDRGDDDDLEDEIQPPTYEIAAADAVPQYWETTILGGSVHPLANGLGWTPGGAHVGAIEDLIVEGLAVGNFFGFAWNLLVSMTFQFVGFLLTYLLHTTHAARCGSRAGLGITLIQYGFYLRTRAAEIAEGKIIDTGGFNGGGEAVSPGAGSGGGWFSEDMSSDEEGGARRRTGWISRMVQPSQPAADGATLADLFAAQADGQPVNIGDQNITDSMSQSTEWLAYVLMILGWTILLSSMLSYWRIWRWGKSLVDAARREEAANNESTTETAAAETSSGGTGFVNRVRSVFTRSGRSGGSGEDWVLFPGVGHRLGRNAGSRNGRGGRSASFDHPTSIADLEDEEGLDTEDARLNTSERRLLADMRRVGLA
ncbi:related to BSD2 - metal homeostasis protein [Melanopsichium pennsylvanicum]|uniref:Related to BSD2 - metal homeostasis protein n=2 Tax=Melanopsichium pennsylvanicum TaxID=63383 RepID=A0AAJ4XRK2_9BASI|nr:related to BSD2-metal homeostasis protein [Melanopsichium pennsylvanicum 4]SNX87220.1 related to BSD2 - metal homeostasis protein [Melanopsichium pennsylvanicum]